MAADLPAAPAFSDGLAFALVTSSDAPLLLLDGALDVLVASKSFGRAFHVDPAAAAGRPVFELGAGEWNLPKLRALLNATALGYAAVEAYEIDLIPEGSDTRRLVIKAERLQYDLTAPRILVTVSDVTDARLAERVKDDLLREKAILIQEVQHRVANSLQIIASVLLQSAKTVQSEESRTHLHDARNRVMAIATVQKHLASAEAGDVELRPYFIQLCQSLGASMIRDHDKQEIEVTADNSKVRSDVSVSLGLIVTELVINALKHAFPGDGEGVIKVAYQGQGPNWILSVTDNGVGMPSGPEVATPGLGTSIVEAVARQLQAKVGIKSAHPGTEVSITHLQIAAVPAVHAV